MFTEFPYYPHDSNITDSTLARMASQAYDSIWTSYYDLEFFIPLAKRKLIYDGVADFIKATGRSYGKFGNPRTPDRNSLMVLGEIKSGLREIISEALNEDQ